MGVHINRFLGFGLCFPNGISFGWNWVHGNGETSKTSAVIAAYHHPKSITWRFVLTYSPPKLRYGLARNLTFSLPQNKLFGTGGCGSLCLGPIGGFFWQWQGHMFRD